MAKPTRNELHAEYYLRAACVASVWIDAAGHVGAEDVVSIGTKLDRLVYCCARGVHFTLAYRLYEWKKGIEADQAAIAAKLEDLADCERCRIDAAPRSCRSSARRGRDRQ
jgi:hypothetical protein